MDLFIYSDESGVFDKKHNNHYVFGGLLFFGKDKKDIGARKYLHAERVIREAGGYNPNFELKACRTTTKEKYNLYRSLNQEIKFGVVINQQNVLPRIFNAKKDKQRYLDYAYKICLKRFFESLIKEKNKPI